MVEMKSQLGYVSGTISAARHFGRKTQGEWECSIVTAIIRCSGGYTHHELTKACESTQPLLSLICLQRPLECCLRGLPN
jgi:hypothetical protein